MLLPLVSCTPLLIFPIIVVLQTTTSTQYLSTDDNFPQKNVDRRPLQCSAVSVVSTVADSSMAVGTEDLMQCLKSNYYPLRHEKVYLLLVYFCPKAKLR